MPTPTPAPMHAHAPTPAPAHPAAGIVLVSAYTTDQGDETERASG
jgi:hypothetical protein